MPRKAAHSRTINEDEVSRFSALAASWWNPHGPMAPLHRLNPVRLDYVRGQISRHFGAKAFTNLRLLDVGCGAGLMSEAAAKLGLQVTGVDASAELIEAAHEHARQSGVSITYQQGETGALVKNGKTFDVVLALEVIEHVENPAQFVDDLAKLVTPGGLLILSTLNRSAKGFLLGIVGAEYVLRWLPAGTHDWRKFVKPSELAAQVEEKGLAVTDIMGLCYSPFTRRFYLDARDVEVNYLLTCKK
jgi:2-polyprenyl-6-hydroxyphenyl methylase/3-demethylubiquinone-9 3-methyltransferase